MASSVRKKPIQELSKLFEQGGFADVFKHMMLARSLKNMNQNNNAAWTFVDYFAGAGKTKLDLKPSSTEPLSYLGSFARRKYRKQQQHYMQEYMHRLNLANLGHSVEERTGVPGWIWWEGEEPQIYPGSLGVVEQFMRGYDNAILFNSKSKEEYAKLCEQTEGNRRIRVTDVEPTQDLVAGMLPTAAPNGLVYFDTVSGLDPKSKLAYSSQLDQMGELVWQAVRQWPTAMHVIVYPIGDVDNLMQGMVQPDMAKDDAFYTREDMFFQDFDDWDTVTMNDPDSIEDSADPTMRKPTPKWDPARIRPVNFLRKVMKSGCKQILNAEVYKMKDQDKNGLLGGVGVCIVNPPFNLEYELRDHLETVALTLNGREIITQKERDRLDDRQADDEYWQMLGVTDDPEGYKVWSEEYATRKHEILDLMTKEQQREKRIWGSYLNQVFWLTDNPRRDELDGHEPLAFDNETQYKKEEDDRSVRTDEGSLQWRREQDEAKEIINNQTRIAAAEKEGLHASQAVSTEQHIYTLVNATDDFEATQDEYAGRTKTRADARRKNRERRFRERVIERLKRDGKI